ncbi:hypothetical protein HNP38_000454 [Chryseobacterium defluvii]|uniref:WG repeat protein n=1 Tax=Chryseobacterium defluvii TaxID=160396 RepID=A0A840KDZ9_9FLAO|nr:hypothetical protein [Chryseobacterium defluvii]MBB4805182.1 hypothetical protein [Chryseobacterium defluvii]
MKIVFAAFILFSGMLSSQHTIPDDYRKIPEILDKVEYLYPFIQPDQQYEYWKVLSNEEDQEKAIIYESQMPESMTINEPAPAKGFFQKCFSNGCFSYIIACKDNRPEYFTTEKKLRDFIGVVDNIPEAILIAQTYGFLVDSKDKSGGSYKIENDHILMYLSKVKYCPETKESFWVKIDRKTGKLESRSNGIYYKSDNCIHSLNSN